MPERSNTVCFTCGLQVGEPPQLNRLTTGQVCPACRDRVLESVAAPLPARGNQVESRGDDERALYPATEGSGYAGDPSPRRPV